LRKEPNSPAISKAIRNYILGDDDEQQEENNDLKAPPPHQQQQPTLHWFPFPRVLQHY
jgi:hypothetical protein